MRQRARLATAYRAMTLMPRTDLRDFQEAIQTENQRSFWNVGLRYDYPTSSGGMEGSEIGEASLVWLCGWESDSTEER